MATKTILRIKNTMARLVTIDGIGLVPGQVTEIPNTEINARDVKMDGLEVVGGTADAEAEGTVETDDVLHPESPTAEEKAASEAAAKTGWKTPKAPGK